MKNNKLISLSIVIIAILLISGCELEPFPDSLSEPEGTIHVLAVDSDGIHIEGASIYIDGIERPEKTSAYIHGIIEGVHDLVVTNYGFWSDSTTFDVTGGDTISITPELEVIPDGLTGFLTVTSEPSGARLLINGKTFLLEDEPVFTPATVELPWSSYSISVHKEGFATLNPILPEAAISVGDTVRLDFTLESGEIGGRDGMIPFDFTLENEVADSIRLSDLTGQVVLLNFWYADCVPCMREFPYIETVYREFASSGFNVLAIDPMFPDDVETVVEIRKQLGLSFQLLLDWTRQVSVNQYNVNPYPRNILVDRTGRISVVLQSVEEDELRELVKELIGHSE
jgi:peroxiredoxin